MLKTVHKAKSHTLLRVLLPMALFILLNCTKNPAGGTWGPLFSLDLRYGEIESPGIRGKPKPALRKACQRSAVSATDLVRVMVIDFSAYDSWNDLTASDEWHRFEAERDTWEGELTEWGDWKALIAGYFPVITDQSLSLEDNSARGKISGVIGLNGFIAAFFDGQAMTHWGEGEAVGVSGTTQQVALTVQPVGIPLNPLEAIAHIEVGQNPQQPVFSPDGDWIYTANFGTDDLSIISVASLGLIETVPVLSGPLAPVISPGGDALYIACVNTGDLAVFSTASRIVEDTLHLGSSPGIPGITPDGERLYIPKPNSNELVIIYASPPYSPVSIDVGNRPITPVVSPAGDEVYVVNVLEKTLAVIGTDIPSVITKIPVGDGPAIPSVTRDPAAPEPLIFVPNSGSGSLTVISKLSRTVSATLFIGGNPQPGPAVSPDGGHVYVTDGIHTLSVVSTQSQAVVDTITVGLHPRSPVISHDGRYVYVPNEDSGTLSVVETFSRSVILTLEAGSAPYAAGVSPDDRFVAVSDRAANAVHIFQRQDLGNR